MFLPEIKICFCRHKGVFFFSSFDWKLTSHATIWQFIHVNWRVCNSVKQGRRRKLSHRERGDFDLLYK